MARKLRAGFCGCGRRRDAAWKNVLAPGAVAQIEGRMVFPLISSACLFGGMFLVLARVLLWVVALVISGHRPADRDEA
jgi:hypothetical protein